MTNGEKSGVLYLVPTPIGNLEDMTLRALRILKEVAVIAAEDTRTTQKLLNYFDIHTPQTSYHEHNEREKTPVLLDRLRSGERIAQVSDAGMPLMSDPGAHLVQAALAEDFRVVPLPGANAAQTALVASGLPAHPYYFYGFLPPKRSEREKALHELALRPETVVLYESPHRVKRFLKEAETYFGADRRVALGRELTKKYEEFIRGTMSEVREHFETHRPRGEFVVVIAGNDNPNPATENQWENWTIKEHVSYIISNNHVRPKEAMKEVAKLRQMKTRDVYAIYHELR